MSLDGQKFTVDGSNALVGQSTSLFAQLNTHSDTSGYRLINVTTDPQPGTVRPSSGESYLEVKAAPVWIPDLRQDDFGFGAGWNLAGLERIIAPPAEIGVSAKNPIYWIRADGYILHFDSPSALASNDENATQIQLIPGGGYGLTDKYGNRTQFDPAGWITRRWDRYGNETEYTYDSSATHKITGVWTQKDDHVRRFVYGQDGLYVSQIYEFASMHDYRAYYPGSDQFRVTTIDAGPVGVRQIWLPGVSPEGTPSERFQYDNGRLHAVYDGVGNCTTFDETDIGSSDLPGHITATTHILNDGHTSLGSTLLVRNSVSPYPKHPDLILSSSQSVVGGTFVVIDTGPPRLIQQGTFTDELRRVSSYKTNTDGYVTQTTGAAGHVTNYTRNSVGEILTETVLDGNKPTAAVLDKTTYVYDGKFNLTDATYFDGTSEHWTYGSDPFSRPHSYTDALGHKTLYSYVDYSDSLASNFGEHVVTTRQIVGQDDSTTSGPTAEHNDIVTIDTYNPQGLISENRRVGYDYDGTKIADDVTTYAYTDPYNPGALNYSTKGRLLLSTTYAADTGGPLDKETVTVVARDSFGNPTQFEDKLARDNSVRETYFRYDEQNRITDVILDDPDGPSDPLDNPDTHYVYDGAGQVQDVIQTTVNGVAATQLDTEQIDTHYKYDGATAYKLSLTTILPMVMTGRLGTPEINTSTI